MLLAFSVNSSGVHYSTDVFWSIAFYSYLVWQKSIFINEIASGSTTYVRIPDSTRDFHRDILLGSINIHEILGNNLHPKMA